MEGTMSDTIETPEVANAETSTSATSAGEPVATGEPVAAGEPSSAEAAEPVGEQAAPVGEVAAFPSADDFEWDTWNGSYDNFDERLRPWGEKLHSHYGELNKAAIERASIQAVEDSAQWKDMYNALAMGEEDPRVAQMGQELAKKNAYVQQMEQNIAEQRKNMEQLAEAEATRYMEWFESVYKERLEASPEAAKRAIPLLDLEGVEISPHEAFEISLIGESAVEMATKLLKKGNSVGLVKEVLQLRTRGETRPVATAPPKPAPKPQESSKLVAGAEETAAPPRPKPKKSTSNMPRHQARAAAVDAIFDRFKL